MRLVYNRTSKLILVLMFPFIISACVPDINGLVDGMMNTIPNTHPGKRMKESLELINAGDSLAITEYVMEHFTDEYLETEGLETAVSTYLSFFHNEQGLDFVSRKEAGPRTFIGYFQSRRDGSEIIFGFRVEQFQPRRIMEIIRQSPKE